VRTKTEILLDQEAIAEDLAAIGSKIARDAIDNKRNFENKSSKCGFLSTTKHCLKIDEECRLGRCQYVLKAMKLHKEASNVDQ